MSPQTVEDLSEKHLTIHLVRANIRLVWRQAAAGDQLAEGLKGEQGELKVLKYEADGVSVTVQQGDRMCCVVLACYLTDRLLQVVSPDVNVVQRFVNFHSSSQRQQTLHPDVVTADRQPDRQTHRHRVCDSNLSSVI